MFQKLFFFTVSMSYQISMTRDGSSGDDGGRSDGGGGGRAGHGAEGGGGTDGGGASTVGRGCQGAAVAVRRFKAPRKAAERKEVARLRSPPAAGAERAAQAARRVGLRGLAQAARRWGLTAPVCPILSSGQPERHPTAAGTRGNMLARREAERPCLRSVP